MPRVHALPRAHGAVIHERGLRELLRRRICGLQDRRRLVRRCAEVREHRQLERLRKRVDRRGAVSQARGHHAGAADGTEHGAHFGSVWLFFKRGEVEAHRGPLEEAWRGCYAARQLVEDGAGISRANTHLRQADLTKTNFQSRRLESRGRGVHRVGGDVPEKKTAGRPRKIMKCTGRGRALQTQVERRVLIRGRRGAKRGVRRPILVTACACDAGVESGDDHFLANV